MTEGDDGQRRSTTFRPVSSQDDAEADAEVAKDTIKATIAETEG